MLPPTYFFPDHICTRGCLALTRLQELEKVCSHTYTRLPIFDGPHGCLPPPDVSLSLGGPSAGVTQTTRECAPTESHRRPTNIFAANDPPQFSQSFFANSLLRLLHSCANRSYTPSYFTVHQIIFFSLRFFLCTLYFCPPKSPSHPLKPAQRVGASILDSPPQTIACSLATDPFAPCPSAP